MKILIMIIGIFSVLLVFCGAVLTVHAQSDLETIKYRNLVIDLGNGVKTNAQLTYPAVGKGPFPGVLLIQGTLITYPGLGHDLSPAIGYYPGSSMYGLQTSGPIEDYALADLYSWLEAHSGLSYSYATPASFSRDTGSNSSSNISR
jgi:hypothetical protein